MALSSTVMPLHDAAPHASSGIEEKAASTGAELRFAYVMHELVLSITLC